MAECPVCFGDGHLDFTEDDAAMVKRFGTAVLLELVRAGRLAWPLGLVDCSECEGTGVVSADRARDLHAVAVAAVDQALAEYERRKRLGIIAP